MDDIGEEDLILAGGLPNGMPVDESAYKKMLMDSAAGFPGIEGGTASAAVIGNGGQSAIEVKNWIQWYLI
jgi:hypothetical protein